MNAMREAQPNALLDGCPPVDRMDAAAARAIRPHERAGHTRCRADAPAAPF